MKTIQLRKHVKKSTLVSSAVYYAQTLGKTLQHRLKPSSAPLLSPLAIHTAKQTGQTELSLCLRAKNEARFLPEWIAHHIGLGFQHIYIYDNGSTDDSLSILRPLIDASLVTLIDWPHRPASPSCYYHFLAHFASGVNWVAFFDADEFLMEEYPGALAHTLDRHRNSAALALNWRYFGSSGHQCIPEGMITENFQSADTLLDRHVKVIARPQEILECRNSHNFYYRNVQFAKTTDGRSVFGSFVNPQQQPSLYLNHYVYRSKEDYLRKSQAGFVDKSGAAEKARILSRADSEFSEHNQRNLPFPPDYADRNRAFLIKFGYSSLYWNSATAPSAKLASHDLKTA